MSWLKVLVMAFVLTVGLMVASAPSVAAPQFAGDEEAAQAVVVEQAETADAIAIRVSYQDADEKNLFHSVMVVVDKLAEKIRLHAVKFAKLSVVDANAQPAPAEEE